MKNVNSTQASDLRSLLADAGELGCSGASLLNHGFNVGMLADLVWSAHRYGAPRDAASIARLCS